ncbi:MAG: TonB family protein [archaeon]
MSIAIILTPLYIANVAFTPKLMQPTRVIPLTPANLGQPPSITDRTVPPTIRVAQATVVPPAYAKPVAVPDEQEKEIVNIPSQEELALATTPTLDSLLSGAANFKIEYLESKLEDSIPSSNVFIPYEVAPQPIVSPLPDYPEMAKTAGVTGKVVLKIYVDNKGAVRKWEIMKATPQGLGFEEEAIEAIQQWKFTPAIQQNSPVGVWVAIPLKFVLK